MHGVGIGHVQFGNAFPVEGNRNFQWSCFRKFLLLFRNAIPVEGNRNFSMRPILCAAPSLFGNAIPVEGNRNSWTRSMTSAFKASVQKRHPGGRE